uniref:Uncharacterized protein n=1 Tax=Parascaris equorum TaxID=6256 RepID=A0A914RVK5_PAREQ
MWRVQEAYMELLAASWFTECPGCEKDITLLIGFADACHGDTFVYKSIIRWSPTWFPTADDSSFRSRSIASLKPTGRLLEEVGRPTPKCWAGMGAFPATSEGT